MKRKILKKILSVLYKLVILMPLYCMMPDKYSGIMFDEWVLKQNKK
ncbi:hypothetical protein IJ674_06470 [bacterium]|nr:hypothetical protein [bacterium]